MDYSLYFQCHVNQKTLNGVRSSRNHLSIMGVCGSLENYETIYYTEEKKKIHKCVLLISKCPRDRFSLNGMSCNFGQYPKPARGC